MVGDEVRREIAGHEVGFLEQGQVAGAVRHTQAAGDWPEAARLLADHSFSLTLDGQARTVEVLVRAFPLGAAADPELALVRAGSDLLQGHLDEATAHLAVATSYAETTTPDRRRCLEMAIASLRLWLARRRADLTGVVEQAGFLASPVTGRCGEEIAIATRRRRRRSGGAVSACASATARWAAASSRRP